MVPVVAGSIPVVRPNSAAAGLVLAGGRAIRLGGIDKALLPLGAHRFLDEILYRLGPQVGALAISANGDAGRFAAWGLPVLPDAVAGGPLAGVLAGLCWAEALGATTLLTVPGDTPFIPANLLAALGAAPACARSASGTHHLVALWPIGARAALAAQLAAGNFRVSEFGAAIGMRSVLFHETPDPFFNVNSPADLDRIGAAAAPGESA